MYYSGDVSKGRIRLPAVFAALALGGTVLVGVGSMSSASAYVPNGCKNGEATYLAYSGATRDCAQWTGGGDSGSGESNQSSSDHDDDSSDHDDDSSDHDEDSHDSDSDSSSSSGGGNSSGYVPNGCKNGQSSYTAYSGATRDCAQWTGGGGGSGSGESNQSSSDHDDDSHDSDSDSSSSSGGGNSSGYVPNGCKNGQSSYTAYSGATRDCAQWTGGGGGSGSGGGGSVAPARTSPPSGGSGGSSGVGILDAIAKCESGSSYTAQNPSSSASGKYQFIDGTWNNYGGYARAKDAPPAVQEAAARDLYERQGTTPWNASKACWG